jgi:cell division protein DivIC
MRFIQIINYKKFTLISIFVFIYFIMNLLDGERGLISYFEKQKIKESLVEEKNLLLSNLNKVEKQNSLLTENIDTDYLETLYRIKFMVGKENEKLFIN